MKPLRSLTAAQTALIGRPPGRIFLEGIAGTGKTTAAVGRLLRYLSEGVRGDAILVLTPQRTLAAPYADALRRPEVPAGVEVTVLTLGGLAQRMIELFWPAVAADAGFAHPERAPVFLTLESAQYFMARIVGPLLDEGFFDAVNVERNRLYSQILDNLNKAAVAGFPHTEIASRLKAAWVGESSGLRVFDEAQTCAERFRAYCLAHNLLDFSLQYEIFVKHLWTLPLCRGYLTGRYRHLFVDNLEEDTPVAHDLLAEWLPLCESALLIYDREAGHRRFLGADPVSAYQLAARCSERVVFTESLVMSPALAALATRLDRALARLPREPGPTIMGQGRGAVIAEELTFDAPGRTPADELRATAGTSEPLPLAFTPHRYHPEMLDWVAGEISQLVHGRGVSPEQIVVLAPFLSDALRFALEHRLQAADVPVRSHRPSRALREEPITRCLLTLAALCFPAWGFVPSKYDVAHALTLAIADMDLVRAQLLTDIAYRRVEGLPVLGPFVEIEPAMQERITFVLGGRYEGLRTWIAAHQAGLRTGATGRSGARRRTAELDHFWSRLFGELLSQPGYGFHGNLVAGEVTANLIESARKFRQVMSAAPAVEGKALGQEYLEMVRDGVVAAQYVRSWRGPAGLSKSAVLLAPAYTFLMSNRCVDHQFWLDVGSTGWWERLHQPLTHPHVLSRQWPTDRKWTDADEYAVRQTALARLAVGLVRRCRVQIHLGLSELGEQGLEQRGPLLRAIQRVLRNA